MPKTHHKYSQRSKNSRERKKPKRGKSSDFEGGQLGQLGQNSKVANKTRTANSPSSLRSPLPALAPGPHNSPVSKQIESTCKIIVRSRVARAHSVWPTMAAVPAPRSRGALLRKGRLSRHTPVYHSRRRKPKSTFRRHDSPPQTTSIALPPVANSNPKRRTNPSPQVRVSVSADSSGRTNLSRAPQSRINVSAASSGRNLLNQAPRGRPSPSPGQRPGALGSPNKKALKGRANALSAMASAWQDKTQNAIRMARSITSGGKGASMERECNACARQLSLQQSVRLWDGYTYCRSCVDAASPGLFEYAEEHEQIAETVPDLDDGAGQYLTCRWGNLIPRIRIVSAVLGSVLLEALGGNLAVWTGATLLALELAFETSIFAVNVALIRRITEGSVPSASIAVSDGQVTFTSARGVARSVPLSRCRWCIVDETPKVLSAHSTAIQRHCVLVFGGDGFTLSSAGMCGFSPETQMHWTPFLTIAEVPRARRSGFPA
jgi:hypothetical protein